MLTRGSFARIPSPLPRCPPTAALDARLPVGRRPSPFSHRLGGHIARFEACSVFMFIRVYVLTDPAAAGPFGPEASTRAVTDPSRSGCFRLEHQLPGGISSSHWISAPFPRRTRKSG